MKVGKNEYFEFGQNLLYCEIELDINYFFYVSYCQRDITPYLKFSFFVKQRYLFLPSKNM